MPSFRAARSTTARRRRVALGLAVFSALALPALTAAQDPADGEAPERVLSEAAQLAEQYVGDFVYRARLTSDNALLAEEVKRLETPQQGNAAAVALAQRLGKADPSLGRVVARMLEDNVRPVLDDLDKVAGDWQQRLQHAQSTWVDVRTTLFERELLLAEMEKNRASSASLASLLSVDRRAFWLFGLLAVAVLVGAVIHGRRHPWRRRLAGRYARAAALAFVLFAFVAVAAVLLMGDRIVGEPLAAVVAEPGAARGGIEAQCDEIRAEIEPLEEEKAALETARAAAVKKLRDALAAGLPAGSKLAGDALAFHDRARQVVLRMDVLEGVAAAMQLDLASLAEVNRRLADGTDATITYLRLRSLIRAGVGISLLGLALGGGWLYRRATLRQRRATSVRCPRCLRSGRLKPVKGSVRDDASPKLVRCHHVIRKTPKEACGYTFGSAFRSMPKLCFGALGIRRSGKTHWLAMLRREFSRGAYANRIDYEDVESFPGEDYDRMVAEMLERRTGPPATPGDHIPYPAVFGFRDNDLWGRSRLLVNVFDYSGDVTSGLGIEDYRRRRALRGDGLLFFLDPTSPSESQEEALAALGEDLRQMREMGPQRRGQVPVALCVPKIDLLAGQHYALPEGGDAIARFYADLAEVDPTGEALSVRTIEARSRLTARLAETIWPGWEIERQVSELSGGRALFFPLTPVGLDGRGESDLSLRTFSPFGLAEPLLWLTQMNGYPVLS